MSPSSPNEFVAMLDCQRHLFDIPDDVAYLNCAYISPLLNAVRDAGIAGTQRKSHPWEIFPRDFFTDAEEARGLFAELIGATANDVALGSAASYGTATAARNLPVQRGQRILVLQDQFPSNVYSWHALANESDGTILTLQRPQDDDWTRSVLEALDERVAIAALPHVHWTDGAMLDLVRIGARCREVGAALVIDGTQSVGVLPFDVNAIQPDFLAVATYKWLLGPYGAGSWSIIETAISPARDAMMSASGAISIWCRWLKQGCASYSTGEWATYSTQYVLALIGLLSERLTWALLRCHQRVEQGITWACDFLGACRKV